MATVKILLEKQDVGTLFRHHMAGMSLFDSHPDILQRGTYTIQSQVRIDAVVIFMTVVTGGAIPTDLDYDCVADIRSLCDEFGFHGFDTILKNAGFLQQAAERKVVQQINELESRAEEYQSVFEDMKQAILFLSDEVRQVRMLTAFWEDQVSTLEDRVAVAEECSEKHKKEVEAISTDLRRLKEQNSSLDEVMSNLQQKRRQLDEHMSALRQSLRVNLPEQEFPLSTKKPLQGIIHYLMGEERGETLFTVTSSAVHSDEAQFAPINVARLEEDSVFFSKDEPNPWIRYDFKGHIVTPSNYALRSMFNGLKGGYNPKTWVFEGSMSGREGDWQILDERKNNSKLNDKNATQTFSVKHPVKCRMVRLRLTGPNHFPSAERYALVISSFEIFGKYK